jgi:tRNA pseudouridine13 synthase
MTENLPFLTKDLPGIGGKLRQKTSHFIVEEIPLYSPSGTGSHLYLNITKESMTTKELCSGIAKAVGIDEREIGYAGMKDKHAITTQTFSIPIRSVNIEDQEKIIESLKEKIKYLPVKLNWAKLHTNKLRTGHLLGNRFIITITGLDDIEKSFLMAEKICQEIKEKGIPNYFGAQRFGVEGDNAERGRKIITGELRIRNPWLQRFLVSSFQSQLCNEYLALRMERGFFSKILEGDIAKKYETGGMFEVTDVSVDQPRYDSKEISFTAPIYGTKMWPAIKESAKLEDEILEQSGITMGHLGKLKILGTRRLGRLLITDLNIEKSQEESGIKLSFSLPKGAFATTVLREIMKEPVEISQETEGME